MSAEYRLIEAPIYQAETKIKEAIKEGWMPVGSIWRHLDDVMQAMIKDAKTDIEVTDYQLVIAPIDQIGRMVKQEIVDGWKTSGSIWRHNDTVMQALVKQTGNKEGSDGADGMSAYELAQEEGFEGSLSGWLESLQGSRGKQGPQGETGQRGKQGPQGAPGKDGEQGPKGDTPSLSVSADEDSGLQAASDLQELAKNLSARIKALEDA